MATASLRLTSLSFSHTCGQDLIDCCHSNILLQRISSPLTPFATFLGWSRFISGERAHLLHTSASRNGATGGDD